MKKRKMKARVGRAIFYKATQRLDSARNRAPKKFGMKDTNIKAKPLRIPVGELGSFTPATVVRKCVSGKRPPR